MKRLFTRLLLVTLLTVLGTTMTWAQKSVLDESFGGGSLPKGWSIINSSYWDFTEGNAKFFAPFKDAVDTLVAPMKKIQDVLDNEPSVAITYKLAANGTNENVLKVLYRTSTTEAWTEWETLPASDESVKWKKALPNPKNSVQIAIAAAYDLGGETRLYRVALENKSEATDAPTDFEVEELKTTSAHLVWAPFVGQNFDKYNIKVNSIPLVDMSLAGDVADTNSDNEWFDLTNLQPDSEYWCYVQYDCGYGDVSPWAELSFRTPCKAIIAPYSENFEGDFSNCYTVVDGGSVAAVSSEYAYNSTHAFKSNSGKGNYNYFILPEFNGNVQNLQLSFMAAAVEGGNNYARTVTVGVCTEAKAESFTAVKNLSLPKGRTWEAITVSFKGYTGSGKYIALKIGSEEKENRLFIDNIKIEAASACPKPMFLEAVEINSTSAKLKWVEAGNATEWNLVLSLKPLNDPEEIDSDHLQSGEYAGSVQSNPFVANNLTPNTKYYAYIQAGCGSGEWTDAVSFTTSKAISYPYHEAFDRMPADMYTDKVGAIPDGWVMDYRNALASDATNFDKVNSTNYMPYVKTTYNHNNSAYVNASLLLRGTSYASSGAGKNISSIAMLPAMPKDVKNMQITFWAYSVNGACDIKIGVANTQTNDLPQGQQLGANITEVASVSVSKSKEWVKYIADLSAYAGTGRYITLYLLPGTGTPEVYIDDIDIHDIPSCYEIVDMAAEAVSPSSARASWNDISAATSWKVKVSSTPIDPVSQNGDIANGTVSAKEYTATGLQSNTAYYFYISPACADKWEMVEATTLKLTGTVIPYFNDFTNETSGYGTSTNPVRGPLDWKLGYTYADTYTYSSSSVPYVYATTWDNAPFGVEKNSLYLYNTATASTQFPYAIMPEVSNADIKDLQMSFYAYTTLTTNLGTTANPFVSQFKIGVVESINDINKANGFSKVTEVATIKIKASKVPQYFVVDMSGYTGTGKCIVFYNDKVGTAAKACTNYIDNVAINLKSANTPHPVSDLAVSDITTSTAKLTWTPNGNETQWDARVFATAQDDPEEGDPVWSSIVSTATANVANLTVSTQKYYAYVRSVQANGNSAWAYTSFYAACGAMAVPFYEDFNSYATGGTSNNTWYPCYSVAHSSASSWPYVRLYTGASVNHESKSNLLSMEAATGKVCQLEFPEMSAPVNTLQIELEASGYSSYVGAKYITFFGVVDAAGTFHEIAQRTNSAQKAWEPWLVDFSTYDIATYGDGKIAIRLDPTRAAEVSGTAATKQYVFIENVKISKIPVCKQIQPDDIEFTEVGPDSATISWPAAEANKWNLKVSTTALENPATATADIFDGEIETNPSKKFTGISDNTVYYVYVQTVRPDQECVGDWSRAASFKTLCFPRTFPYEENFEGYVTGAGSLPDCSNICGDDAASNPIYISTKSNVSGQLLRLYQSSKGHNNYFVLPALEVDSVKRLQLSMQVYTGSTSASSSNYIYFYEVGVMTDPNDPTTYKMVKLDSVQGGVTDVFDRVCTFESYTGDALGNYGTYIAIKPIEYKSSATNTGTGWLYIDNIAVDLISTCAAPADLRALESDLEANSAKLTWTTDDKTAAHRVRIFTKEDANPNIDAFVAEAVVNDSVAVVDGLHGNTVYYAFVRKECGTNDLSKWSSACKFITECEAVQALPYEEGFEGQRPYTSVNDKPTPACWTNLIIQGCGDYPSYYSSTAEKDGEYGLYLQTTQVGEGSCSGTQRSAVVTPALDVQNLKELLVYFDTKAVSTQYEGSIKIEAVSDETLDADVVYITTINGITNKDWMKGYIRIRDYYSSAQPYNRLRFTPSGNTSVYIDNMVFTKDLNVIFPVENLKLLMLAENSVKFSFVETTPVVNQWEVAYVAEGGDIADATIITIDATEYTLTGLQKNTSYDIYVRGKIEGDEWVGPLTVATLQTPAQLPYSTGFEKTGEGADADLWNLYNVQTVQGAFHPNFWIVGDAAKCDASGSNALFVTNDSANWQSWGNFLPDGNTATSYVWATRNIEIPSAGTYKFSIRLKSPVAYSSHGVWAHLIPAGGTFKSQQAKMLDGTSFNGNTTTTNAAIGRYSVMPQQFNVKDWIWYKQSIDIEEAGTYTLAFYWYNTAAGAKNEQPVAIDSVIVEEYLCTTPKNIELTHLGAEEVSFKWFAGQCKNFEYVLAEYKKLGDPAGIDAADKVAAGTISDGPQVTISNLLPSTNYSFYVRTLCPDGETEWIEFDFSTPCILEQLPYTEAFYEDPECWLLNSNASIQTLYYKTDEMAGQDPETWPVLQLNQNGLAILPELDVPLNKVQIEIGAFNKYSVSSPGTVTIGVVDNMWTPSSFKELAQFTPQTIISSSTSSGGITYAAYALETFTKLLNTYQGTGKHLALKNNGSTLIYIKYVSLTELPDCVPPQQVEITYPKENEFTVNWIAGLEEQWEIQLNDSLIKNVTTNPYKITGLEQGTTYTVAVRAICDEVHPSEWSMSAKFTTPCGANELPLLEDFSGMTASNKRASLTCWNNLVTDYPIEQVFKGNTSPYKPAPNLYYTYMWIANYLSQLGDEHQLLFFGSTLLNGGPKYRWMITPRYAIEGNASLSFDVKHVDNKNKAAHPEGRFIVAISTDNGASWKKDDATLIEGIDSVYTTKSVSLNQYVGKDICVAFYMENLGGETTTQGSGLFTLLDNVRINCTEEVILNENACEKYDYEQNGFLIKKEELAPVGQTKTFTRFETVESGCDKNVILNLTTRKTPQIDAIHATICEGEFYEFGGQNLTKPNPDGQPYYIGGVTTYGCDSTIYLYLTVEESDTTNYANPIVKTNAELPFAVDNYFELKADVLPENETTRTFDTIVVHDGCHFWRYSVTVNRCTVESDPIEESICENAESYNDHGFVIPSEEFAALPAVGETKVYTKTVRNALKCDSTATLRLTVLPNDTTVIPVTLFNNEVKSNNYKVDEIYTIPYGTPVGKFVVVKPNGNKCGYNRYDVDIQQCTRAGEVRATICEHETEFNGYNFVIPSDEFGALPTAGGSKQYTRHDWTADGCDSTTTLYLNVLINDTADIEVPIQNTDLLNGDYVVDEYFSVPAETEIGADFDTIVNIPGTCEFNKYHVTVTKCEIPVSYTERICEGSESYKGYGFDIKAADMPAPLETKTYERHNLNEWGCDSVITLRLTAWNDTTDIYVSKVLTDLPVVIDDYYSIPSDAPIGEQFIEVRQRGDGCEYNRYIVMVSDCASSDIFEDAICSVETSYEGYGFTLAQEELPAAGETKPYYRDEPDGENSCKHITLKLTVIKNDTTDIYVTKLNTELPFTVDGIYTIPAGTAVGSFVEVLPNGQDCKFNRYNVTIEQATQAYRFTDAVCEDVTNYTGYGFNIAPEDMPAANSYQRFERHGFELDELGVDSIITLTLTVQANDTTFIEEEVFNNELPYMAGDEVVIQAGVPFGEQPEVVLANNGTCAYTSYKITVNQCVRESVVRDSICEGIESYMGYGFSMPSAEFGNLPAPGKRIEYVRHETTGEGCDSIITLSLKVMKIDTVRFASIDVQISELPYDIDKFYSIPAGTPLGEGFAIIPNPEDECGYRRYAWNITPCTEKYPLQREFICGDADYVAHGFNIPAAELPAVGESKEFTRTNKNELGCDSIITITLTVNAPDTTKVEKTVLNTDLPYIVDGIEIVPAGAQIGLQPEVIIASTGCVYKRYLVTVKQCTNKFEFLDGVCEGENYNGYGFSIAAAELPEAGDSKDYTRTAKDEAGCDSVITLTLIVNEIDTVDVIEEVLNTQLPYMAGEQVVVPAGAPIGEQPEVILYNGSCIYNRYIITVNPCEENYEFDDDVCAGADYNGYGFSIAAAQLPATGGAVDFTRTAKDAAGCDSLITLTLMVSPSEIIALEPLEISVDALPYKLNDYITIPADLEVGVYEGKVQVPGECLFYSYSLTVHESGWGIINVTDDVESIEVYDLLGRLIFTLRQGEVMKQQLPTGVYMLHSIMKSGAAVNSKVVLQ